MESAGPRTRSKARQTQSPAPVSAAKSTSRKGARSKDATGKDQASNVAKVLEYEAGQEAGAGSDLVAKDTPVKDTPTTQASPATPPQAEYYAPSPTGAIPGLTPIPAIIQPTPDVRKGMMDSIMKKPLAGDCPASYMFSPGVGALPCSVRFHAFSKHPGADAAGSDSPAAVFASNVISTPVPADTPVMGLVMQPAQTAAGGSSSTTSAPTPPDFASAPGTANGPTPTLTGSTTFSEAPPSGPPTSGTEAAWRDGERSPSLAGGVASAAPATATPAAAVSGSIAASTPQSAVTPFEARMAEADRSPSLGPVETTPTPAKAATPAAAAGDFGFGSPVAAAGGGAGTPAGAPHLSATPMLASPVGDNATPKSGKKGVSGTPKTPASAGLSPGATFAPPSTGRLRAMMEAGPLDDDNLSDEDMGEDMREVAAAGGEEEEEDMEAAAAAEGDVEMGEGVDLDTQMAGLAAELEVLGVAAAATTPGKRTPAKSPGIKTPASTRSKTAAAAAASPAAGLDATTPSPPARKGTAGSASSTGGSYSSRAAARAAAASSAASPLGAVGPALHLASPGRTPYPTKGEAAAGAAKAHSNQAAAAARLTTMVGPKKAAAYSAASSALQQSAALSKAAAAGATRAVSSRLYEPTASSLAKCHRSAVAAAGGAGSPAAGMDAESSPAGAVEGPKPRLKSKVVVPSPAAAAGGSTSSSLGALKAQHKAAVLQQKARKTVAAGAAERDASKVTDFTSMRQPKSATKAPPEASVDMSTALGGSDSEGEEVEQAGRPHKESNKENEVVEALTGQLGKMGVAGVVHQQGVVLRGVPAPTGKYKRFDEEEAGAAKAAGGRSVPRNRPVALRGVAPPQGKHISFAADDE